MIHPDSANCSREDIKKALVTRFKTQADRISVFGLKTKFGGGRSSGFALIYNSTEDKKKYDSKTNLRRVSGQIQLGMQSWLLIVVIDASFVSSLFSLCSTY